MSRTLFKQLFDAPAEIVVAHGRVVLTAISLTAVYLYPTQPVLLSPLVFQILSVYATYALAVLAALHWRVIENPNSILLHVVDIATVALLLLLTDGLSSPFLVFFPFVMLAASLRWDWQGTAVTIALLIAVAAVGFATDFMADGRLRNLNGTIIRAAYLVVMGTALAYASAHREFERARLLRLAQQSSTFSSAPGSMALASALREAATPGQKVVAVWKEDDDRWRAAVWSEGQFEMLISSAAAPPLHVAPALDDQLFSRIGAEPDRLTLVNSSVKRFADALRGDLLSKLDIKDFTTAPFRGVATEGRIFVLGQLRLSDDHLPITKIVADRVGAEIDRQIFLRRATEDAAARERTRIMRDLHDGLLQSLTAARAQIEALPTDAKRAESQLETARNLLRMEQQRVREFVDSTLATGRQWSVLDSLRPHAEEAARLWGCSLSLTIDEPGALVSRATINELSLMLAEAVANAVRHGEAGSIEVALRHKNDRLQIEVRDNGRGFMNDSASFRRELAECDLPRSLYSRVRDLGGRMQAWTSGSGATLRVELPL